MANRIEVLEAERDALAGKMEEALEQCADALNVVAWGGEFTCFVDAQWITVNNALDKARDTLAKLEDKTDDHTD